MPHSRSWAPRTLLVRSKVQLLLIKCRIIIFLKKKLCSVITVHSDMFMWGKDNRGHFWSIFKGWVILKTRLTLEENHPKTVDFIGKSKLCSKMINLFVLQYVAPLWNGIDPFKWYFLPPWTVFWSSPVQMLALDLQKILRRAYVWNSNLIRPFRNAPQYFIFVGIYV